VPAINRVRVLRFGAGPRPVGGVGG